MSKIARYNISCPTVVADLTKDTKNSNGTFIDGEKPSPEGFESGPYKLKSDDLFVCPFSYLIKSLLTSQPRNLASTLYARTTNHNTPRNRRPRHPRLHLQRRQCCSLQLAFRIAPCPRLRRSKPKFTTYPPLRAMSTKSHSSTDSIYLNRCAFHSHRPWFGPKPAAIDTFRSHSHSY